LPYFVFALRFCIPLPFPSPQYTAWLVADKFVNNERREVGKVRTGAVTEPTPTNMMIGDTIEEHVLAQNMACRYTAD